MGRFNLPAGIISSLCEIFNIFRSCRQNRNSSFRALVKCLCESCGFRVSATFKRTLWRQTLHILIFCFIKPVMSAVLNNATVQGCVSNFLLLLQGHLYVGTAMEVQRLPLADCGRYGDSCRECILSRDPYCAWDRARRKCIAIPPGYNVTTG